MSDLERYQAVCRKLREEDGRELTPAEVAATMQEVYAKLRAHLTTRGMRAGTDAELRELLRAAFAQRDSDRLKAIEAEIARWDAMTPEEQEAEVNASIEAYEREHANDPPPTPEERAEMEAAADRIWQNVQAMIDGEGQR